jgi:asparagine synthase (glutamine-hydrolysing)
MCGIYGFSDSQSNSSQWLKSMGDSMSHRGPDGEGIYTSNIMSMGMRRLSIQDVEKGNQPFFSQDQKIIVMCNGEIYNFKSLREDLIRDGYSFSTHCDIEIIPHLYEEYGIGFIEKLNGIFSIALLDRSKNIFYLIRDRLGVKPLYYGVTNNELVYASELKSILAVSSSTPEIDYQSLSAFLDLMYIPTPNTPFTNIHKLESGSYLAWTNKSYSVHRYWDLLPDEQKKISEQEYLDKIDNILTDSIDMELISDVPIGSFLSGGIDSSIVTKLSSQLSLEEFSVFHMRWKEIAGKMDESIFAEKVIENTDVKKYVRDVDQIDVINLLPKLIYHLDEPFADAAFIPTYYLANIASEHVKVILSGAGGDELFGGYPHYKEYPYWKSFIRSALNKKAPAFSYYDLWQSGHDKIWKKLFPWYTPAVFKGLYDNDFRKGKSSDKLNEIMLKDIQHYLQDDILFLTDKMTMAASLECRVPLLDHRLVELSQTIPSDIKIQNADHKYLFKKYGEQYLDKSVLQRPKEGFGFPIEIWINSYKEIVFHPLLENGCLVKYGLIDVHALRNMFFVKTEYTRSFAWIYWKLIILEIWFQLFVDNVPTDSIYKIETL